MGITKATFRCDNCGKKRTVRFPASDGRNRPKGWYLIVYGQFAIYVCGKKCGKEWESQHGVGRIHADGGEGGFEQSSGVPTDILEVLFGRRGQRPIRDENSVAKQMAKEFGMPQEIISEFFEHVTQTECPRCNAKPEERCHAVEGDDVEMCETHGPELKATVHAERVKAAKDSWKGKLQ